jgi:nicotinamide-nucleotide amidase
MVVNPIRTAGLSLRKVNMLLKTATLRSGGVTVCSRRTCDGIDVFVFDAGGGNQAQREVYNRVCNVLSLCTYGVGEASLGEGISRVLIKSRKRLAIAESLTGGLISDRLTDFPGSSGFFMMSVVVYSDESKVKLLGVPEGVIKRWGAVSRQTCRKMLEGLSGQGDFNYRIAVTGIAGPAGGSSAKPVGTVFAGVANEHSTVIRKLKLIGTRREVKEAAASAVLQLLWDQIKAHGL